MRFCFAKDSDEILDTGHNKFCQTLKIPKNIMLKLGFVSGDFTCKKLRRSNWILLAKEQFSPVLKVHVLRQKAKQKGATRWSKAHINVETLE